LSTETIVLIAGGDLALVMLVLCLLAMAKHGDEELAWEAEHRRNDEPKRRDAA
jgi:hypothetical protein